MQATGQSAPAGDRLGRGRCVKIACALSLTLFLCACGGSSDPQQTIESIRSWSATLALARIDRVHRRVPDAYARQLLDRAREARQDAARSLGSGQISRTDRQRADSALAELDTEAGLLATELRSR